MLNILAVQGPKSFKLMEKIFGKKITEIKFFGFDYFELVAKTFNCKIRMVKTRWI